MKHSSLKALGALTLLTCLSGGNAHAALMAISIGGGTNNAVYDSVLDITWLSNANLAATNTFGVTGINSGGAMHWHKANEWIDAMNADNNATGYLGVNTWRQPEVKPVNGTSFDTFFSYDGGTDWGYQLSAPVHMTYNPNGLSAGSTASELAYHYYNNLGAVGAEYGDGTGIQAGSISSSIYGVDNAANNANLVLFNGSIENTFYWTETESTPGNSSVLIFVTEKGFQIETLGFIEEGFVWAVAPGNVSAVPVPAAVWLMGSALFGLAGVRRKKAVE